MRSPQGRTGTDPGTLVAFDGATMGTRTTMGTRATVMVDPSMTEQGLSLAQLRGLTERLTRIAQRNRDVELAELVAYLISLCATLAEISTADRESFTMTPSDYAKEHDIPVRTVQWMCMKSKLPAIKPNGRWRIRNDR